MSFKLPSFTIDFILPSFGNQLHELDFLNCTVWPSESCSIYLAIFFIIGLSQVVFESTQVGSSSVEILPQSEDQRLEEKFVLL